MRHRRSLLSAAALLVPLVSTAQPPPDGRPNVIERVEAKFDKNPGLRKLIEEAPPPLDLAKWMLGAWEVSEKTYATSRTPEKVRKGTADVKLELGGRWIVSRMKLADGGENVSYLGFDPWKKVWYWQYFSAGGRGTNSPLVSQASWDEGRLNLSGTLFVFGEPADVALRVVRWDETLWAEILEERVSEQDVRPLFEIRYSRKKAADGKAPAPASAPKPVPPPKSN